jgi:hypothetical protein
MSEVNLMPMCREPNDVPMPLKGKPQFLIIKQEQDEFSPSNKKITASGCAIAGVAALGVGKTVYEGAKNGIGKLINWFEKENNARLSELGKDLQEIPKNLKVNGKYLGAILAGISTALLVFKDSDKDGKLDILEAAQQYVNPTE